MQDIYLKERKKRKTKLWAWNFYYYAGGLEKGTKLFNVTQVMFKLFAVVD